jgi:hypothetical protein
MRLLTVKEFASLPKGDLVALDELFPPNTEKGGKSRNAQ